MRSDEPEERAAVDECIAALEASIRLGRASANPQKRVSFDDLQKILDEIRALLSE
jgi:hypothetical protein